MNVHLELLTVILWVLFALSLGLAVWGLARRSAKAVFLAALPAGVFAFFFFSNPFGRVVFAWPLTLLTAALSLRWPGRRREWLLLAAGNGACAGGVLMWSAGLFGYAGLFAVADGSTAKVYATRRDRMMRVQTTGGDPYLLSPAEPDCLRGGGKENAFGGII